MLGTLCFGGRRGVALTQCGGVSSTRKPPKHQSLKDNSQFQSCVLYSKSCNNPLRLTIQTDGLGQVSLLQGIFPTQGSNPGLPHCRRILYQLSHQGSPLTYSIYKANAVYTMRGWNSRVKTVGSKPGFESWLYHSTAWTQAIYCFPVPQFLFLCNIAVRIKFVHTCKVLKHRQTHRKRTPSFLTAKN